MTDIEVFYYQTQLIWVDELELTQVDDKPMPLYEAVMRLADGDELITYMSEN